MKKINILVVLVFCTVSLFAQFASNWQVDFQDSPTLNYSNEGRKVITDANSNIFVLGDYSSDRDSAGHTTGTTQYTVRLQKYNYNGVLQTWVYIPVNGLITNGFDNRNSFGLELDASGNVYIGYSVYNNSGDFDLVIRKYSNTLTLKWTYVYATSNQDVGVDLKLNGTTAYAIVKSYAGANTSYALVAASSGGNFSVPLYSFVNNVDVINALNTSGNKFIYVTGYSLISGAKAALTAAISSVGTLKWKVNYNHGSVTGDDLGNSLELGSDGYIYVAGTTYTSAANGTDALVLKYSASGIQQGLLTLDRSAVDVGCSVKAGPSGYMYVASSNASSYAVYKVQMNPLNANISASSYPTPISSYLSITNTVVSDMKVAASGNVYVCGYVDATSAAGNFSASFLEKLGLNGFLFKTLKSNPVEGSNVDNYRPVCMVLDGYKADILVLRNEFSPFGSHAFESVNLMDYDGGSTLRLANEEGVSRDDRSDLISVYPNPAKDIIHLHSDTDISSIEISDITGNLVKTVPMTFSRDLEINISDIRNGLYFCRILSEDGKVVLKKLIVE